MQIAGGEHIDESLHACTPLASKIGINFLFYRIFSYSILCGGSSKSASATCSAARTRDLTLEFANLRAELWWRFREALDPQAGDDVSLPPDARLAAQLATPTWRLRGNAIVIESKDEVRKWLGASTDDADAVILAWHQREAALARQQPRRAVEVNAFPGGWMA